jgi:hypothetical protein
VPGPDEHGLSAVALRGATVEAPEDGVLVAAGVHAKRIAGAALGCARRVVVSLLPGRDR